MKQTVTIDSSHYNTQNMYKKGRNTFTILHMVPQHNNLLE